MKKTSILLYLLYLVPLLFLVLISWRLFMYNYVAFTEYLAASLQKPEWKKFIQLRFTASAFVIARWIIILLAMLYIGAGVYLIFKGDELLKKFNTAFVTIRKKTVQ